MHFFVILVWFVLQLASARFQYGPYHPNPPAKPLRRGEPIPDVLAKRAGTPVHTYTRITPSPGARAIAITTQYQVITSYVPLLTLCSLSRSSGTPSPTYVPPNMPVSSNSTMLLHRRALNATSTAASTSAPDFPNGSRIGQSPAFTSSGSDTGMSTTFVVDGFSTVIPVPSSAASDKTISDPPVTETSSSPSGSSTTITINNATTVIPLPSSSSRAAPILATPPYPMGNSTPARGTGTARLGTATSRNGCTIHYSPAATTVCHTVLKGLAAHHTVTDCNQLITYSSNYGYSLTLPSGATDAATLTPQPGIITQTTYYEAPWTDFTASTGVPKHITEKVCSRAPYVGAGQECVDCRQAVQTRIATSVFTTSSTIDVTTTLPGPSRVVVQTFEAEITEVETVFSLSTRVVTEVSTEGVETSMSLMGTLGTTTMPAMTSAGVGSMGPMETGMSSVMSSAMSEPRSTSTSTITSTVQTTVTSTLSGA